MTNHQKNIEIALMLGFIESNYGHMKVTLLGDMQKIPPGLVKLISEEDYATWKRIILKFDTDANWQFEALEFIEKLDLKEKGYKWELDGEIQYNFEGFSSDIEGNTCWIYLNLSLDPSKLVAKGEGNNKKEAIFEALYQFSQYIKDKK